MNYTKVVFFLQPEVESIMKKMALFEKEEEEEGKQEEKKAKNFDAVEKEAAEENKVRHIFIC